MRTLTLLISLTLMCITLYAQNSSTIFEGKISISDDSSTPIPGSIRFNSGTGVFEGYNGEAWMPFITENCICPYLQAPFDDASVFSNYNLNNNKINVIIQFSHRMNPASFNYGSNVIISSNNNQSSSGSITWSRNNTVATIITSEDWTNIISNCFDGFAIQINGSGNSPVSGINGLPLDGDRDGCCGGLYEQRFSLLC